MPAEPPQLYGDGRQRRGSQKRSIRFARHDTIAIVGAGYVGVPLAHVFAEAGTPSSCSTSRPTVSNSSTAARATSGDVPSEALKRHVDAGLVSATTDYDALRETDAILVRAADAAFSAARA